MSILILGGVSQAQAITFSSPQEILPPTSGDITFATNVAISDSKSLVSSPADGVTYVFDTANGSPLGSIADLGPIAVNGDNALIGANLYDLSTLSFVRSFAEPPNSPSGFGNAVDIDGNFALIGAMNYPSFSSGKAYLFDISNGLLVRTFQNPISDPVTDYYANSVSLSDSFALIGAPGSHRPGGAPPGAAYLYSLTDGTLLQTLHGTPSQLGDQFGWDVSVDGSNALVGAAIPRSFGPGIAKAFLFDTSSGSLLHSFEHPTPSSGSQFGATVALSGNTVLIGSPYVVASPQAGSVFEFDAITGVLVTAIVNPNAGDTNNFGRSLDMNANYAILGATPYVALPGQTGKAFIYSGPGVLTVNSIDTDGNPISGYFTVLSQGGVVDNTGFTPAIFSPENGIQHNVQVQNFANYIFGNWLDTGSTTSDRDISINKNTEITAIYINLNSPPPADSGKSKLSVMTDNTSGEEIFGYYTTLWLDDVLVDYGFSPEIFEVDNGVEYQVAVSDYGNMFHNYWDDTSANPFRTFSLTSDSAFRAVYQQSVDLLVSLTGQPTEELYAYFDNTWPQVKYTMTVLNSSPNTAENVVVVFVPNQFGVDSNIVSSDVTLSVKCRLGPNVYPPDCIVENLLPGECLTNNYLWGTTSWTCNLGDMIQGQTINISSIVFNVGSSPRTVSGTATVSSNTDDHDLSNNVASLTVEDPL